MLDWVEENKIPCRIAFNAIKDVKETEKDIETIRGIIQAYEEDRDISYNLLFYQTLTLKVKEEMIIVICTWSNHFYSLMVTSMLALLQSCQSKQLQLCSRVTVCSLRCRWYNRFMYLPSLRHHACHYCKYAIQNELIDDVLTDTIHNDFA